MLDLKKTSIIIEPDERLRQKSAAVSEITASHAELFRKMEGIMLEREGIGLAAPQVGHLLRMVVIDKGAIDGNAAGKDFLHLVNPVILDAASTDSVYEEGCLSVPTFYENISRPEWVEVEFTNINGSVQRVKTGGLLARCILHEVDHLDGKLFIDYISRLKKHLIINKLKKMKAVL